MDLASYFSTALGTVSGSGKAGGAGYKSDISSNGSGDVSQPTATSGSGFVSVAANIGQTDKSQYSTPFYNGFGGISNNQGSGLNAQTLIILALGAALVLYVLRK